MSDNILRYAIIKTFYDSESEDYVSSFIPLIIKTFSKKDTLNVEKIQNKLKSDYDIDIPIDVIRNILSQAVVKKLVTYNDIKKEYHLEKEGKAYLDNLEDENAVKRTINSLLADLTNFFKGKGYDYSEKEVEELLNKFISKNIVDLAIFLNIDLAHLNVEKSELNTDDEIILDYIFLIENKKPQEFEIFYNMVLGSIMVTILGTGNNNKIEEIQKSDFSKCNIYLDSNFIFSALGLHHDVYAKPAKELLKILKEIGFKLKIFNFTLDEITRVLKGYKNHKDKYISGVEVDSIYSVMKSRGYQNSDVIDYIASIENRLNGIGVEVDNTFKDINLRSYRPTDKSIKKIIEKKYHINGYRNPLSLNHDVVIVEKIKELRGNDVRKLSDCQYIFLSSDTGLSSLNFMEMGHKSNNTIPEVIKDSTFTNIVWLKNPRIKLPLSTILSFHSKKLFINKRVWDKFSEILNNLINSGKITNTDASMLIYDSAINNELKNMDESEINKLSEKSIFEKIKTSKEHQDLIDKRRYQNIKVQYEDKLEKEVDEKSKKLRTEYHEKIKTDTENSSREIAKYVVIFLKIIIALFIALVIYYLITNLDYLNFLSQYSIIIPITVLAISLLGINFSKKWEGFERKICIAIYGLLRKLTDN